MQGRMWTRVWWLAWLGAAAGCTEGGASNASDGGAPHTADAGVVGASSSVEGGTSSSSATSASSATASSAGSASASTGGASTSSASPSTSRGADPSSAAAAPSSAASGSSASPSVGGASSSAAGTGSSTAAGPARLTLSFLREPGNASPSPLVVTATLQDGAGTPVAGRPVQVEAPGAAVGPVMDRGDGTYTARVVPGAPSGELAVTARLEAPDAMLTAQRTAVVLPWVGDGWGQPEVVRGLVNTDGYEDGGSISPDGQWLVLTDYSPVDVICCINGCGISAPGDPLGTACQTSRGPVDGAVRPDFPGRDRILSGTRILNRCPSVCFTQDYSASGDERTDLTLFPVGGYVFHRQPDGSFAEPQFLGFAADGCVTPTGYSFVSVNGATAQLVYSWTLPWGPDGSSLYASTITLGVPNVLASFTCTAPGQVQVTGGNFARLGVDVTVPFTNPVYRDGILMWEDDQSTPHRTFFARGTGALPGTTFTPVQNHARLAVGDASHDQIMPFLDDVEDRLYFTDNGEAAVSAWNGGDPGAPGSWGAPERLLAPEAGSGRAGAITALGQPTVAHLPDGSVEAYFIYALWTGTGINMQVGVLRRD